MSSNPVGQWSIFDLALTSVMTSVIHDKVQLSIARYELQPLVMNRDQKLIYYTFFSKYFFFKMLFFQNTLFLNENNFKPESTSI